MESEISARLKTAAQVIGYSENQFIVASVKAVLDVVEDKNNAIPQVVVLIRSALKHQAGPSQFAESSSHEDGVKHWWGAS